jgi:hypothetical protein
MVSSSMSTILPFNNHSNCFINASCKGIRRFKSENSIFMLLILENEHRPYKLSNGSSRIPYSKSTKNEENKQYLFTSMYR